MKNPAIKTLPLLALVPPSWAASPVIDVYKSPDSGCCKQWLAPLKALGFSVRAHDTGDVVSHTYRQSVGKSK